MSYTFELVSNKSPIENSDIQIIYNTIDPWLAGNIIVKTNDQSYALADDTVAIAS